MEGIKIDNTEVLRGKTPLPDIDIDCCLKPWMAIKMKIWGNVLKAS